tara:strand:+ start:243 stop:713 length:471 start_codon:yes stop_codon:yes gene_type:complete
MAIFSGKIIEAYFANSENNAVEVIYKDGKKAINHYLKVDFTNQDFKDLIAEYDTDKIAEATIARNRNYAKQISDLVDEGIKSKTDVTKRISVDDFVTKIINYDDNDPECKEILFTMKIGLFEIKKVKENSNKDWKAKLRSARTPIDLLAEYKKIND